MMTNEELTIALVKQSAQLDHIIAILQDRKEQHAALQAEVVHIQKKINYAAGAVMALGGLIGIFLNTVLRKLGVIT